MRCRDLLGGLLWLVCASVGAQGVCYEYRAESETAWESSPGAACAAGTAENEEIPGPGGCFTHRTYSFTSHSPSGSEPSGGTCYYDRVTDSGDCGGGTSTVQLEQPYYVQVAAECPPDECDAKAGTNQYISSLDSVGALGSGSCYQGCQLTAVPLSSMTIGSSGAYDNVMYMEFTGDTCGTDDSRGGKCSSSSGKVICSGEPERNCGTVNGDEVCIESVSDANPCVSFESGAVACLASAPDEVKPDNGTPGMPADPDAQVVQGDNIVNYYFSTTVNNSSTPVSSDPSPDEGGSSGGGSSGGEEGEGECVPGEECAGDLPSQGSAGECDDFTACFSTFLGRVQGAPILEAVNGVSAAFPTGACPAWNLEAFGETYALSAPMCEIWDEAAPILSAAFLFIWGWVATRIFLSA